MAYSSSRRWEAPEVQATNAFKRKELARKRFSKHAFEKADWVLPRDHAQETSHHAEITMARESLLARKQAEEEKASQDKLHIPISAFKRKSRFEAIPTPDMGCLIKDDYPEIGLSMSRFTKVNLSLRGSVLSQPTIWLSHGDPDLAANKRTISSQSGFYISMWPEKPNFIPLCVEDQMDEALVAEWPCAQEYKYEGDDRIATDIKHSRFLPVPRKPGNSTVNWQQLPFLGQHEFDQVHCGGNQQKPSEEDALFMELEVGFDGQQEEHIGYRLLGRDLMEELDPVGIFTAGLDFREA